jgi:Family of unknown function (DUF5941)
VTVRQTMATCSAAAAREADDGGILKRLDAGIRTLPASGRVLLIAVLAPVWGPRAALLGVLVWTIIAVVYGTAGHGPGAADSMLSVIASRDDGVVARYLGRLVRGQLVPLPPALAGLAAASMLAVLGLRHLPGFILLTPLVVMLLAAPGSSHPHDGRCDWLAPAVLQAGQYVFIAALGFASSVAPPVIFALCAMIAIRSADLAYQGSYRVGVRAGRRSGTGSGTGIALRTGISPGTGIAAGTGIGPGTGMGWEGRMLVAGLGAIAGIATFTYLALTAYLGVLVCWKVRTSSLAIGKGGRP